MNDIITILPRSRLLHLSDCADAARLAGQSLWWNGKALVAARRQPSPAWHRLGILRRTA